MRSTRTYTQFFTEETLEPVRRELAELTTDWEHRVPHIDSEIAEQGQQRLEAARLAVARLNDRVVE